MSDEARVCDRCDEEQPLGEDGKCDWCDGFPCDGCGARGGELNDDNMCAECEPPVGVCDDCGNDAVVFPVGPHAGLCEFCAERAEIGEVCEVCGASEADGEITDGLCDDCHARRIDNKPDDPTPRWLKDVIKDRKKKIAEAVRSAVPGGTVDWKKRFGCGHYGCAYAVKERDHPEPRYVVKVTRDPTEGPMQATIARRQKAGDYGFDDGFAIVRGVYRIGDDVQHLGKTWPVYAVVREEVTPVGVIQNMSRPYRLGRDDKVGGIYPPVTPGQLDVVMSSLNNYKDLAAKWYTEKAKKKPQQRNLDRIEEPMNNALSAINTYAPTLGQVMSILQSEGTPLRDVHGNNVGVRHHEGIVDPEDPKNGLGYIVIFDPGHTPYEGDGESQIPRMNPRSLEDAGKLPSTLVKGKPFEVTLGDGTVVFVSKDPQSREWRATKFVGGKPRGHFVVGLWEDAVAEVESRWWTEDLSGAKSSGWSHNPPDDDFTYTLPSEHLSAAANPAAAEKGFHDAFGIPYEAHLAPVWPKERRKYERKVRSPKQLAEYLAAAGDIPQEQFMVALLDASGALIGIAIISKGTLNEAAVHPREVFAAALAARAAGIIGIHNHPSGEVTPSDADVNLSKVLGDVGAIVGIPFLDHVVLGRNGEHTSMAQVGMLPKATRRHQNNPELNPPKSPEERAVDQEMERLDREKRRLFYEERDKVPVPASGWYDEEYTKGVHKKIRPLTDPIDAQLRELRAQKKAIRAAEAAAKASRPKKVPGGARGPEIRQGRCKKCDVRYKWVERPDVKTGTSGPNQWWRGIACPKCGGTLWRTATAPGSYLDSYVDLDAPGAGRPSSNPGVDGFDFADAFGQPAEPAEPGRFHLDTLKRGDVVRVGKTRWHVFNAKHGAWVVKYGTSGKKMYQIYSGGGDRFVVQQMTGGGDLIGDPVAEGDAEVVGWEERA